MTTRGKPHVYICTFSFVFITFINKYNSRIFYILSFIGNCTYICTYTLNVSVRRCICLSRHEPRVTPETLFHLSVLVGG